VVDQLYAMRPDAVTALNRAVAIGEMRGAAAGLDALDSLDVTPLEDYQPYHAARADLLARAGRRDPSVAADCPGQRPSRVAQQPESLPRMTATNHGDE
jgi:RNA polymerase sigma-70 factor, ECF subfamily